MADADCKQGEQQQLVYRPAGRQGSTSQQVLHDLLQRQDSQNWMTLGWRSAASRPASSSSLCMMGVDSASA